jgi:predicted kinase
VDSIDSEERADAGAKLMIICGLPGSGKTIVAKRLENKLRAVRLCPDEWMDSLGIDLWDGQRREKIEVLQWRLAQELLSLGLTVIIEWGTWARSERDELRTQARALGATVELYYLAAPIDVLYDRIRLRAREYPPISRDDLTRWAETFQAPTAAELALFDEHFLSEDVTSQIGL